LCRTHQKQTASFQPPEGIRCNRIQITTSDNREIPCFVVEPEEEQEALPGILMIHGGAFYLPVQTSALSLAYEYAKGIKARFFLPEYRLVPQSPAPAALEDCLALWEAMHRQQDDWRLDTERLLIMGDSAGAALAAGLCILLRDKGLPLPKGQMLIYPALDDRTELYASYEQYAEANWSPAANRVMWTAYLKGADEKLLPILAPLRCEDLHGLPFAYIEPQEIDILQDEGVAYAQALSAAGVSVELNTIMGSYHGFDSDLSSSLVKRVVEKRIQVMQNTLK
jgi:acetyl esterase/lipase